MNTIKANVDKLSVLCSKYPVVFRLKSTIHLIVLRTQQG